MYNERIFLKIVLNTFKNQSRNKRELSVVGSFNNNIIVMAKGKYNSIDNVDGYTVYRRTARPLTNNNSFIKLNRFCSIFSWAYFARKIKPYGISCHNLIALFIGWLSTWFVPRDQKPILVYDSHEFSIGYYKGGKFTKFVISRLERFLIHKCALSIMVNESIANEVSRIHRLKKKPIVVRNIPKYWTIDENVCRIRKQDFYEQLGLQDDVFLVMYHGEIKPGRGIENLLISVKQNINIAAVILGNEEKGYLEQLKQLAEKLEISGRVLFHEAVAIDVLWEYVGAADVGMITIPAVIMNYYYMLPNKLFENIQSLTPIISSDFPEISRIIKGYDIGLCVNPENVDDIANAIEEMRTNKERYNKFKNNLKRAKEELCWENECKILEAAYAEILR